MSDYSVHLFSQGISSTYHASRCGTSFAKRVSRGLCSLEAETRKNEISIQIREVGEAGSSDSRFPDLHVSCGGWEPRGGDR